jgi:hypothetical protein
MARLGAQNAVLQTARVAYANALKKELDSALSAGETIKFSGLPGV